jgi:hypothetical protein
MSATFLSQLISLDLLSPDKREKNHGSLLYESLPFPYTYALSSRYVLCSTLV